MLSFDYFAITDLEYLIIPKVIKLRYFEVLIVILQDMKDLIKRMIKSIPIDFTKNQAYDSQTKLVLNKVCKKDSNCIDIGCHKGEVLDLIIKYAPEGTHFGFEPIPLMYEALKKKYAGTSCHIYNLALSEIKGTTAFNHVVSNPAYSGIRQRKYDKSNEVIEMIDVKTDRLDNVIPIQTKIDLIKIDVEGAEYQVLSGGKELIRRHHPVVIFEHGMGASDFYGTTPEMIYDYFESLDYSVSTMKNWLNDGPAFNKVEFSEQFYRKVNYYFIAYKKLKG